MGRAQIWDGAQWVSMTGGAGEDGGGGEPDDTYLRLDGANNNTPPNQYITEDGADGLYLPLSGGTINGILQISSPNDHEGLLLKAGASINSGGGIRIGANQATHFAEIEGNLQDGGTNSSGGLDFNTRRLSADTDPTLAFRLQYTGQARFYNGAFINTYEESNIFEYQARNVIVTDSFQGGSGAPSNASGSDGDLFFYYGV